ncbi:hypothetical protein [Thiococcus pfennigii]|uniref:hypothetical protein n=1 Tax=Thiococcus pfennigii TaxID=1057 RepID=UPI001903CEF2|nr:hypothetical protein [Thiococcus pfennigii]MBK1732767.1 hypothetical protein [Thiococcus pfennigii]
MVSRGLALLLLISLPATGAECPGAARLEEALEILGTANPVLRAEGAEYAEALRQRSWAARLDLGYDTNTSLESGAAGARAALRVEIPLWDRTSSLERAKAHADLTATQAAARQALLTDVQSLCELASQVAALDTLRAFARDRLAYRQERVDEGIDPADVLWSEAEAMQRAEHDWRRERGRLEALRLTLARRHGGAEWQRLRTLFEAMTQ